MAELSQAFQPLAGVNPNARGMKNNNPGNLESNSWTSGLPGYAGTDGRFAIFSSPEAGLAALDHNLQGYGKKGIATPLAIASTWAPGSEKGNNPNSYGASIARSLGVGPNDRVDMADPAARAKIASAIALVENGPGAGARAAPPAPAAPLGAMASLAPPAARRAAASAPNAQSPPAPAPPPAASPQAIQAPAPSNPYSSLAAIIGSAAPQLASAPAPEVPQTPKAPPRDPAAIARALTQGLAGNLTLA